MGLDRCAARPDVATAPSRSRFEAGSRSQALELVAALMLANGAPAKVVQERLGHSSVMVTLDIYSHVAPGMQRDATDRLALAIDG